MAWILMSLLHLLVAFLSVATLLAILCPRRPVLGVAQHWGLQLWQLGLLALIGSLLLGDWNAAAPSVAVAFYWSWRLWPRKPAPEISTGEPLLRLVSANLLFHNLEFDRKSQGLLDLEADVMVLSEVTDDARRHLGALEGAFPHALDTCSPDNLYGIVILSRIPITLRSRGIGEDPLPRHLAADLAIDGCSVTLVVIHPTNPLRLSRSHRIPAEFDAVASLVRAAPDDLILIGDCNAAGWSSFLRMLEQKTGLANDGKVRPSWPVWLPPFVRLPLDHVWVRGRTTLLRADLGPRLGSDHLPLVAEIGFRDQMSDVRSQKANSPGKPLAPDI